MRWKEEQELVKNPVREGKSSVSLVSVRPRVITATKRRINGLSYSYLRVKGYNHPTIDKAINALNEFIKWLEEGSLGQFSSCPSSRK